LCSVFISSRRRHTRFSRDWSSDVCSSDLLTDRVRLSFGGRYTKDDLSHNVLDSVDWDEFIWRANVQYDWTDDVMAYASVGTGYRSEERRVGEEHRSRVTANPQQQRRGSRQ